MDRYAGRVALVTGASSGIGAAVAQALVAQGIKVVGLARRLHRVQALEVAGSPGTLYPIQGDVTNEESILSAFKWIEDNLGGVDILINNAGVLEECDLTSGDTEAWKRVLDVNVLGLCICTREAVQSMLKRGVDDGFIIHISSVVGHIPTFDHTYSLYCASKHAVTALLEGLRKDLLSRKSNIRCGQISPGFVKSELFDGLTKYSTEVVSQHPILEAKDIADAVIYMLSQHPRVQVYDMIIRPTGTFL